MAGTDVAGGSMSRRVFVVGIGAGDPEHLTLGAVRALNDTDAVFLVDKGDADEALRAARMALCRQVIDPAHSYRIVEVALDAVRDRGAGPYEASVAGWRAARVEAYERLVAGLAEGETGAFLVWGDPTLYDGTLAGLDEVAARARVAFEVEVVPGISSVAALAARHRVAINRPGESVLVTTGRRVAGDGWPSEARNVVVLLDSHGALAGLDDDLEIWWGAFLGLPQERLVHGRLGDCRDRIEQARTEARERHGWLFDTYLLRRR
jgi:precorrin-6A synthase